VRAATYTFVAFVLCGLLPLIPYIFGFEASLVTATLFSGVAFLLIGSLKSLWSTQSWWRSGGETLVIGLTAAALSYFVGHLLSGLA
jgi:VIT1/CCC1 family predicted Fe2+/Mn2+ transporter